MSLRRSILLAVIAAVLAATFLEGVLDVALEGLEERLPVDDDSRPVGLLLDLVDVPVFVLLGLGLGHLLSRRIARPLTRLTKATEELATAGRTEAVHVPPGRDELSELVRSFNAMAEAVDEHVERERAFTRYASHELRTPLSAMRLQVERARLGQVSAEDALPVVEKNVRRMEEVLEALLSLARSWEHAAERRPLAPLLEETLASLPEPSRSRVQVNGLFGGAFVSHPRIVQQAVSNLIDNALRHGRGRARVAVAVGDRRLTVRVNDDGPGVPDDALPHLTEPFYKLEQGGEGLGLGLAFVAHVARALGGDLSLSNSDTGLEATLSLPVVAPQA